MDRVRLGRQRRFGGGSRVLAHQWQQALGGADGGRPGHPGPGGERLKRPEQELGEAHDRDEGADAERSVHRGERGGDGDGRDEAAGDGVGQRHEAALRRPGVQGTGERDTAGRPVPPGGCRLGAQPAHDAVAGHDVGRAGRRFGCGLLLGGAAPVQTAARLLGEPQHERSAQQDGQADRPGDRQQHHPRHHHGGELADREDADGHRLRHPGRVRGGQGQRRARTPGDLRRRRTGGEQAVGREHAQPVLHRLHPDQPQPGAEPVREGQHREVGRQQRQPQRELGRVAGGHGAVDRKAHEHGHHRFTELVGDGERRRRDGVPRRGGHGAPCQLPWGLRRADRVEAEAHRMLGRLHQRTTQGGACHRPRRPIGDTDGVPVTGSGVTRQGRSNT